MMRSLIRTAIVSGAMLLSIAPIESAPSGGAASVAPVISASRTVREVTIPAGTVLRLRVNRGVWIGHLARRRSDIGDTCARRCHWRSHDTCRQAAGRPVTSPRPRDLARFAVAAASAVRFTRIAPANESSTYNMRTNSWVAVAPATKKKDALTIGIPAAGGAVIGALVDGKKGAAIGSAAGGGAGTAVVLSTRGKDVAHQQRRDARGSADRAVDGANR